MSNSVEINLLAAEVQAALNGNRPAFGRLVVHFQKMVLGICYRLTGTVQDAEDLAHESFVEAFLKLDTIRQPEAFAGWLKTITINVCRMWYRKNSRQTEEFDEELTLIPSKDEGDETEREKIWRGLAQLPQQHRLALVLYYVEDLSYEDIAAFLDVPIGTVMSRLHRGRINLRSEIEKLKGKEIIPMHSQEQFSEEVDAEISVLLEMFHEQPNAADRLSVILTKDPMRIRLLIAQTTNDEILRNLAVLIPRLGNEATRVIVDCALTGDENLSGKAKTVLSFVTARCRAECTNIGKALVAGGTPGLNAYVLIDALVNHASEGALKARLLVDLLGAVNDSSVGRLYSETLLCFPDETYSLLLVWFEKLDNPAEIYRNENWAAVSLRSFGNRFCLDLVKLVNRVGANALRIVMAGLDAVTKDCFVHPEKKPEAGDIPGPQWFKESGDPKRAGNFRLSDSLLAEVAAVVSSQVGSPDSEVRKTAIKILARLQSSGSVDVIRSCLAHPEAQTRISAVHALAELGDKQSVEMIVAMTRSADASERRAAVEALGQMRIVESEEAICKATEDSNAQVRKAAVTSLGKLKSPKARGKLNDLLLSTDKAVKKAAAIALFGMNRKPTVKAGASTLEDYAREERIKKTFGSLNPVQECSVDAALRVIPESRVYNESELTKYIAGICGDWCATRRMLIDYIFMKRTFDNYEFTERGESAWRTEHFIMNNYLV